MNSFDRGWVCGGTRPQAFRVKTAAADCLSIKAGNVAPLAATTEPPALGGGWVPGGGLAKSNTNDWFPPAARRAIRSTSVWASKSWLARSVVLTPDDWRFSRGWDRGALKAVAESRRERMIRRCMVWKELRSCDNGFGDDKAFITIRRTYRKFPGFERPESRTKSKVTAMPEHKQPSSGSRRERYLARRPL